MILPIISPELFGSFCVNNQPPWPNRDNSRLSADARGAALLPPDPHHQRPWIRCHLIA
jgi:hypothetical protein